MLRLFKTVWKVVFGEAREFLKCDNKGCVYVEIHHSITSDMINTRCPLCNSNLLTQYDYDAHVMKRALRK
jgi:uncharacterized C2H2 Zn-finger protein